MTRTKSYVMRSLMLLMLSALVASVVAVVLVSPVQAADPLMVNSSADTDDGACTTDAGGCTLREAINAANTSSGVTDTINFNLGSTATITLGSQLPDIFFLIIDGGSADITISGDNTYPVFEVAFAEVTLSNLTVANGGIYNNIGTATVSNSTISDNSSVAVGDGGIYNNSGTATVSNSTISGSSIVNAGGGTLEVSNSTISGSPGSGISNIGGSGRSTLEVSNSTISGNGNSAPFGGGGIYNQFGTATVSNSTISGNSAGEGGGIYNDLNSTVTVSNSTISDNSASNGGGINNKVVLASVGPSAIFKNTIVADNHASFIVPDVRGPFNSQGHNLIGQSECTDGCFTNEDLVGTSANPIDPMVGPLANNGGPTLTHALLEGSPAIDKGVAVEGITTDQRGFARPQGTAPDIGSFESEFTTTGDTIKPHVSTATPTGTGIARGTNLAATFSEKMDPLSITKSTFKLFRCPSATSTNCTTQITNSTLRKSTDGLSATLNPYGTSATKLDAKTKYKAVITTGAKDMAGNALDQDQNPNNGNQPKQWTFTTGPKK
jgi:CSLREA domain-containing protein